MKKRIELDDQKLADLALETIGSLAIDAAEFSGVREKGFSVNVRLGDVETLSHHLDKTFSVTVYCDHRTGSASSSDFSQESIVQTIHKAYSIAQHANPDPYSGLPDKNRLALSYPDCSLSHDWPISVDQAIELAKRCEAVACENRLITNSEGVSVSTFHSNHFMGNTLGFLGGYAVTAHGISCSLVAKSGDQMQRNYEYSVARNSADLMSYETLAKMAAEKTVARLNAKRLKTQKCPVIFDASVAKSLLRHFVQAISGSNLYRQSSFLLDALGQTIFPSFMQIQQHPHLLGAMGSSPFDHEGVATVDQFYVKDGVLVSYALGSYSARKLGMSSTGNAGGVFNLTIANHGISKEVLLKKMNRGLLITELMGQGVNITTGDYSRGAAGFWVENGEIQYPVEEITVAGNLKEMFQSIVSIADDVDIRGSIRSGSILIEQMTVAGN